MKVGDGTSAPSREVLTRNRMRGASVAACGTNLQSVARAIHDLHSPRPSIATFMPVATARRIARLTARAVRYYDQLNLVQIDRDKRNYRLVSSDTLSQLVLISVLRQLDLPLEGIRGVLVTATRDKQAAARRVSSMVRERLAELDVHRAALAAALSDLSSDSV